MSRTFGRSTLGNAWIPTGDRPRHDGTRAKGHGTHSGKKTAKQQNSPKAGAAARQPQPEAVGAAGRRRQQRLEAAAAAAIKADEGGMFRSKTLRCKSTASLRIFKRF